LINREIKCFQAINEAIDQCMVSDPSVYIMGLGVPDPKGIFGTTSGLQQKHGSDRVMDMPLSENGMTGVAIGSALAGMRPIMVHQRIEFALLAMEQIVNQASNWHYMFGGQMSIPLVIRLIIGRGWGQGPQHSQSLQAWFAHVPGLKVVMPSTPYDTKGLLISSVEDNNPVVFIEHRWLHNITGEVPEERYRVPIGKCKVVREGTDVTVAATSYMTLEALQAAKILAADGVNVEVVDIRTLSPLDESTIIKSVRKTGRFIVADTGWKKAGIGAEVVAMVSEKAFSELKSPPLRVALPDCPLPATRSLANKYYPRAVHIATTISEMIGHRKDYTTAEILGSVLLDIPDPSFTGPF
jgi:acetoin:2,6-dichlorophenolindophenol oxidoreductase subunit beta